MKQRTYILVDFSNYPPGGDLRFTPAERRKAWLAAIRKAQARCK